jgi:hypothetical protein
MRDQDAMCGYLVKTAKELIGAAGKNQIPINAPRHFRRLRASRGLLPPVHRNPDITGMMVFAELPSPSSFGEISDNAYETMVRNC